MLSQVEASKGCVTLTPRPSGAEALRAGGTAAYISSYPVRAANFVAKAKIMLNRFRVDALRLTVGSYTIYCLRLTYYNSQRRLL